MPCDYRMKNYCFHPERANGKLIAINCVYDWLTKKMEEKNVSNVDASDLMKSKTPIGQNLTKSKMPIQQNGVLG